MAPPPVTPPPPPRLLSRAVSPIPSAPPNGAERGPAAPRPLPAAAGRGSSGAVPVPPPAGRHRPGSSWRPLQGPAGRWRPPRIPPRFAPMARPLPVAAGQVTLPACAAAEVGGVRFGVSRWPRLGGAGQSRGARFGGTRQPRGAQFGVSGWSRSARFGVPPLPAGTQRPLRRGQGAAPLQNAQIQAFRPVSGAAARSVSPLGAPGCGVSPRRGKRRVKLYCCCSGRTRTNRERGFTPGGRAGRAPPNLLGGQAASLCPQWSCGQGSPLLLSHQGSNLRVSPVLPRDTLVSAMVERSGLVSRQQGGGS